MCCLFGMIDSRRAIPGSQKSMLLHLLATVSEERGTDATGVAYNHGNRIVIYKKPVSGHKLKFKVKDDTAVAMGHTRMATQGNEHRNYNNHPFYGIAGSMPFALAHNGVLYNDAFLQKYFKLPHTKIKTDSFVAVQLLEKKNQLNFDSLAYMAEQLEGSFTFTVLDGEDNLYFVKGDNPMCIYYYPSMGLYVYASTEEILKAAISKTNLSNQESLVVELECGQILKIASDGAQSMSTFDASKLLEWRSFFECEYSPNCIDFDVPQHKDLSEYEREYLAQVQLFANNYGYSDKDIAELIADGFTLDDIAEMLCYGAW